ncbi:MAG: 1,3-beta-galactosyl-N-acetylhexosamine phosphorylase [Clostridiales bacterium]|nr:1,3-beta-galactosyl-N-acetylhexosamine phosphorylase [Clostridiales bacterium]
MRKHGRFTIPIQADFMEETKELIHRWGADAVRNSDGTELTESVDALRPAKIYAAYFVARGYNEFARSHPAERQRIFLMSARHTAVGAQLSFPIMEGYFESQLEPDYDWDPEHNWEVRDRTQGTVLSGEYVDIDRTAGMVTIQKTVPGHVYTLSFPAFINWDPTQMYNYITNNWQGRERDIPFDVHGEMSWAFMKTALSHWLAQNPHVDVVRFTTFFYHFTLVYDNCRREKYVDWLGYGGAVSPAALIGFEKEYGYKLGPEDFVDEGYYNNSFRPPRRQYLDYMEYIQKYVSERAGKLVDLVHQDGKEAMMFLGDNWIGAEPYGKYFSKIGLDAVVGSVNSGVTLRMIADIPHVKYTEARFLPYFFPDSFYPGGHPEVEAQENWIAARRAILRSPVSRIGYGGYLSLAAEFPAFVECVERIADEFREILDTIEGHSPYAPITVGVLNCWGELRSWQGYIAAHGMTYKQTYSYLGVLEALSGMAVNVRFIRFSDIVENGIPEDIDVIINAGDAGTAFSGGACWNNEALLEKLRMWVWQGGGFIGVGEPSAYPYQGRYFQLSDVLGVDQERGFTVNEDKYHTEVTESHFITKDVMEPLNFGECKNNVYAVAEDCEILEHSNGEVHLSAHVYGAGKGVYIAGLPYSSQNTRLLLRCLYYAAGMEDQMHNYYAENPCCEVHGYRSCGQYALVNNSMESCITRFWDGVGAEHTAQLAPGEIRWMEMKT